jgi:hypothetical protein
MAMTDPEGPEYHRNFDRRKGSTVTPDDILERERWRRVFGTPDGRYVLAAMLTQLGYFDEIRADHIHGQSLRNYAVRLLGNMGLTHEEYAIDHVKALLSVPVSNTQATKED